MQFFRHIFFASNLAIIFRVIMCEAYKQGMTQKQGYVWFLPGWFGADW